METRNDMSFKKETENMVFLQVKDLIHIIVKFRTKKFAYFYHPPIIRLRGTPPLNTAIGHQVRNKLKVYISLKENKLACFANR